MRKIRPTQRAALQATFNAARLRYPPDEVTLVGLKGEKQLEVWVRTQTPSKNNWTRVRTYPILAASGGPGPKLRQGDLQVPEGIYRLTGFNPNSSYHLSIRVDYPSAEDRAIALSEKRADLGGDIFIHGKAVSIGCLALGDAAIEELYVLLADTGLARSRIILTPSADPSAGPGAPRWLVDRYESVRRDLRAVRASPSG